MTIVGKNYSLAGCSIGLVYMRSWEFTSFADESVWNDPSFISIPVYVGKKCESFDTNCITYGDVYLPEIPEPEVAYIGEVCEGFDESTGGSFPSCAEGLICQDSGMITIPGMGNTCQELVIRDDVTSFSEWLECYRETYETCGADHSAHYDCYWNNSGCEDPTWHDCFWYSTGC